MDEGDGGEGQAGEQEENPRGRSMSSVFNPSLEHTNIHTVYYTVTHTFISTLPKQERKEVKTKTTGARPLSLNALQVYFDCPCQVLLNNQHDH